MDNAAMKAELERDEGVREFPYVDTVGKVSIGIGRNLSDRGVREEEIAAMYEFDVALAAGDLDNNAPWWSAMPETAQRALVNMSFNMGWPKLSGFKNMLAALEASDYERAAVEALDSKWATQVGDRAQRIAEQYREAGRV